MPTKPRSKQTTLDSVLKLDGMTD